MSLIIEDEIEWLKTSILPKILHNGRLLDNFKSALADTFHVENIAIDVISGKESHMLTLCYRATINFKYAGEQQQVKLIVKKTPKVENEVYDTIQFEDLFSNEVGFYSEILPIIQEQTNGEFAAPKYYYSEIEPYSALIVLSDFAADGWTVTKDRYGLSLEHARIAVKYLGRFHGFGYAMKHNQKERFLELASKLREARFAKDSMHRPWKLRNLTGLKRAELVVNTYHPDVDKEFIRKYQKLVYSYRGYGRQRVLPREPYSTLCHSDYLRNNLAYKYDTDSSGTPVDIMMFDYQTMRLCSPMIDLAVFMALSLLAEVRHKNFDSLFDDYCNALFESYTKQSAQPLPDFLNREDLLKEYIRFLPYAAHITSHFLMVLVDPPSVSPAENFNKQFSDADVVKEALQQGGEIVDRELAHQIKEMYDLSRLHNVQIDEDIDASAWIEEAHKFVTEKNELYERGN